MLSSNPNQTREGFGKHAFVKETYGTSYYTWSLLKCSARFSFKNEVYAILSNG
jgi:hypothetical protein